MPLDKEALLSKVLGAIAGAGWHFNPPSSPIPHPLAIEVSREGQSIDLLVYIWNITHGGGSRRSPTEYRIQITPQMELNLLLDRKTLLLGYSEEGGREVFVGFDAAKHAHAGFSASIQVELETLRRGVADGIAIQEKARDASNQEVIEVAVAFRPEMIMDYVTKVYPDFQAVAFPASEISAIGPPAPASPTLIPPPPPSAERARALRTFNELQRDARFSRSVLLAYGQRCAVCGLRLGLLDAAHIVTVRAGSTDEITNGLALCPTHHRAYDRGILGIDPEYSIFVNETKLTELRSAGFGGGEEDFRRWSRVGERIYLPTEPSMRPSPDYLRRGLRLRGFPPLT